MIRIVSDTNIAVSAAIKPTGAEAQVFDAVADGRLLLCVSESILAEYEEVLRRPKLRLTGKRGENGENGVSLAAGKTGGKRGENGVSLAGESFS